MSKKPCSISLPKLLIYGYGWAWSIRDYMSAFYILSGQMLSSSGMFSLTTPHKIEPFCIHAPFSQSFLPTILICLPRVCEDPAPCMGWHVKRASSAFLLPLRTYTLWKQWVSHFCLYSRSIEPCLAHSRASNKYLRKENELNCLQKIAFLFSRSSGVNIHKTVQHSE